MAQEAATIKLGVVGLSVASGLVLPAARAMPQVELVAGADLNPQAVAGFQERYGARGYGSIEALCNDPDVNTVWVATPNQFHCPHVVIAAEHGKHVVTEKPFALSLEEADRMNETAERNGVHLLSGGSRSASPHVRRMREIVRSGELGRVRAMNTWAAREWMLAPRRPEELEVALGGGVAFRQAPHQIDSIRLVGGGMIRSVRGMTGQWMAPRDTAPGYYSAYMEFEDGTPAIIIYEGYGYFVASEFFEPNSLEDKMAEAAARARIRKELRAGARDEVAAKDAAVAAVHRAPAAGGSAPARSRYSSDLGLLVVSCEQGGIRQSPNGVYVYDDEGLREEALPDEASSYSPELMELHEAITAGRPILHGGRWGEATLEVQLAMMESARERREVFLSRQVPVPDGW